MRKDLSTQKTDLAADVTRPLNDALFQFLAGTGSPNIPAPSIVSARMCKRIAACAVVVAMVGGWVVSKQQLDQSREPRQVFYEARVVDASGHPVAGATVKLGNKVYGTTDSFGEWRRFLRTRLGSTVTIKIEKKQGGETLSIAKHLVIPSRPSAEGDTQVKTSLQFGSKEAVAPKVAAAKSAVLPVASPIPVQPEPKVTPAPTAAPTATLSVKTDDHSHSNWTYADKMRAKQLSDNVVPMVRAQLQANAKQISDVTLRHLAVKGGLGLILVQFESAAAPGKIYKVLRNYTNDPQQTAAGIVVGAQQALSGNVAHANSRVRVPIFGAVPNDAHVFASGVLGEKKSDREFEFFAPRNGEINLTVVTGGGVSYRNRVVVKDGVARAVHLPAGTVATR